MLNSLIGLKKVGCLQPNVYNHILQNATAALNTVYDIKVTKSLKRLTEFLLFFKIIFELNVQNTSQQKQKIVNYQTIFY